MLPELDAEVSSELDCVAAAFFGVLGFRIFGSFTVDGVAKADIVPDEVSNCCNGGGVVNPGPKAGKYQSTINSI